MCNHLYRVSTHGKSSLKTPTPSPSPSPTPSPTPPTPPPTPIPIPTPTLMPTPIREQYYTFTVQTLRLSKETTEILRELPFCVEGIPLKIPQLSSFATLLVIALFPPEYNFFMLKSEFTNATSVTSS